MTTSVGTKDRVSFGSGGGLSVVMIITGVILLVFSGIVVGVMIAADYWERGMGPPLIFLVGLALAVLIAGVVPMIRRRRVAVDFMAGEIRTSTERVPLWQVRSVTISSRLVEVPLSGFRRSGSRVSCVLLSNTFAQHESSGLPIFVREPFRGNIAALRKSQMSDLISRTLGHCRIFKKIGEGGLGEV